MSEKWRCRSINVSDMTKREIEKLLAHSQSLFDRSKGERARKKNKRNQNRGQND